MESTLLIGDYLFVEKFAYGYSRYSFPFGGWPFGDAMHGRFMDRTRSAATSIVFKFPQDNSTDYIKRVIGLPGDRIQMINGVLYLNGKPVPRVRVADYVGDRRRRAGSLDRSIARRCRAAKAISCSTRDTDGPQDNTERLSWCRRAITS